MEMLWMCPSAPACERKSLPRGQETTRMAHPKSSVLEGSQ